MTTRPARERFEAQLEKLLDLHEALVKDNGSPFTRSARAQRRARFQEALDDFKTWGQLVIDVQRGGKR